MAPLWARLNALIITPLPPCCSTVTLCSGALASVQAMVSTTNACRVSVFVVLNFAVIFDDAELLWSD